MKRRHSARGDTIIEVVMAVAMFSMLAIGIMALMNSGIAIAQRSLELTLVRQQIALHSRQVISGWQLLCHPLGRDERSDH